MERGQDDMAKRSKANIKTVRSMFKLILPSVVVCLICPLFSPDAICAEADDEFLISLPTDKPGKKQTDSSVASKKSVQKTEAKALDMLQGVFYDLKQLRNRQPNKEFSAVTSDGEYVDENLNPTLKAVQSFVNGTWQKSTDINGRVNYSALNAYYSPTNRAWTSCFYIGDTASRTAPQAFGCPDDVRPNCWICIYSGYVVAPFSGKFRFVGFGDDFLVVRVNQKIVFDYGRLSATLGAALGTEKRSTLTAATEEKPQPQSKNPIVRVMPTINKGESGTSFYSKNKLEIRSPEYMNTNSTFGSGLANGAVVSVRQGEVIPIEILVGDIGGNFNYVLFAERLDTNGKALYPDKPLLLFRTSDVWPPTFSSSSAVAYDKNSPVWKVVDSRGKPIPSHIPSSASKGGPADASAGAKSSSGTSAQPKRDPTLVKNVSTSTRGNVTTQTITENDGETTIETAITTEVNGDTTVETKTVTEKRNGVVVRTSTSTTTTTTSTDSSRNDMKSSDGKAGEEKKESPNQESKPVNPFGVSARPEED